jgi:trimeric autotransporter adhesin
MIIVPHLRRSFACCTSMLLALVFTFSLQAQTFSVYNYDFSAFPRITASYQAFDGAGNLYSGVNSGSFRVVETPTSGTSADLTSTVSHNCKTVAEPPQASIVIVVDRSGSMDSIVPGTGIKRWNYTRDAVIAFVNKIRFVGETRVAVLGFAGTAELFNDWTDQPNLVRDTLMKKEPSGGTNYTSSFVTPFTNIYELFSKRPSNVPRYVFFLTDGHPTPAIENQQLFIDTNVAKMRSFGVKFFGVTILQPTTHETLVAFARETGGTAIVAQEAQLVDLFSNLANETQIASLCTISWISPYGCSEQSRNRKTDITFIPNNQVARTEYTLPQNSLAEAVVSTPVLYAGNPPPTTTSIADVTITARSGPLSISNFSINPNTNFAVIDWNVPTNTQNFAPFTLNQGQSRTIRVQFTQGDQRLFRQALLRFIGTPCPPVVTLTGGSGRINLLTPDGGEVYSTCDTVTVQWIGIEPTDEVILEYSETGDAPWTIITDKAKGLSHRWLPPSAGVSYKIRVRFAPSNRFSWVTQAGTTGADTVSAIAVDSSGARIVATGWADGPMRFGTINQAAAMGDINGYVTMFDSDGNVVSANFLVGNGNNIEKVVGGFFDSKQNMIVAGFTSSAVTNFGTYGTINREILDQRTMFIIKADPTGALSWMSQSIGTTTQSAFADATNVGYRVNGGRLEYVVVGNFLRRTSFGFSPTGTPVTLATTNPVPQRYIAIYDENGACLNAVVGPPPAGFTYAQKIDTVGGFIYQADHFSGARTFTPPSKTLGASGTTDMFVSKFGAPPSSQDLSTSVFSVKAPRLVAAITNQTFDATAVGRTDNKLATASVCNDGDFPVTITGFAITGAHAGDFVLLGNPVGQVLRANPRECASFEFSFSPSAVGARSAIFEVFGSCGTIGAFTLSGTGLPQCSYEVRQTVDLGRIAVGTSPTINVPCVLKNTGIAPLSGTVSSGGSPDVTVVQQGNPFTLAPNQCLDVDVRVNATTAGPRTVTLDFGLVAECNNPQSLITAFAVEPRVTIDSIDFGNQRLRTTQNGNLQITNLNTDPVEITSFQLSDIANAHINVTTLSVPFTIAPNATVLVPVAFTPQTRGPQSLTVTVLARGQAAQIIGEVKGNGVLPVIEATGYTFLPWSVGLPHPDNGGANTNVVIRNTDASTPLVINAIAFQTPVADFTWGGLPALPLLIAPNSSVALPIEFTPAVAGVRSVTVVIDHDAKEGPDPIPPYAQTTVEVVGTGIEPGDIPPIDFGTILTCETRSTTFEIINPSSSFSLEVDAPTVVGNPSPAFDISQTAGFSLLPGERKIITITFTPTTVGAFATTYRFGNNQNLRLSITATGSAATVPVQFGIGSIQQAKIGGTVDVPLTVQSSALPNGITFLPIRLDLTYPIEFLTFNGTLGGGNVAGWTTTASTPSPGLLSILCTPTPTSKLTSGIIVVPQFNVSLTADSSHSLTITASTDLQCLVPSGGPGVLTVELGCYPDGRLIELGAFNASLKAPFPNPAANSATVNYTTGIMAPTRFDVFDQSGVVVFVKETPALPSGAYELTIPTAEFATGVYSLRMHCGPFVATTIFAVMR